MSDRHTRRRFLQIAAGAPALIGAPALFAQAGFDWKRYKGQSIEAYLVKNPRGELLQKYGKEFEELTGITVGMELVPEQQARQKVAIEFASGKPSFDIVHITYNAQKRQFARGKWLADLRPVIGGTVPADFDFKDFSSGAMAYATQADGRIDTLPLNLDPWILYWNKELFAAKGLAYPKSYAEILDAAKKLHDPAKGQYGFVGRGLKNANVPLWTNLFLGYGGVFMDASGKLTTDSPEGVASATLYRDLLKNTGPAGVAGFNWNEAQSLFLQGKAAMWIDGSGFAAPLEDPTKSKVVGKVGYGVIPMGPKKQVSGTFGDGIGVSATSQKQGPSWYFLMWATNKANQARMLASGSGAPVRQSAYAATAKAEGAPSTVPAEWLQTVGASLKIAEPSLPVIEPVSEFRDVYGIALTNMLTGADVGAELMKATAEFQPVLNKSEGKA
ncbi:MAG: sugar ABC transporter substrate-binding protein [Burkholderiales bacterium]